MAKKVKYAAIDPAGTPGDGGPSAELLRAIQEAVQSAVKAEVAKALPKSPAPLVVPASRSGTCGAVFTHTHPSLECLSGSITVRYTWGARSAPARSASTL